MKNYRFPFLIVAAVATIFTLPNGALASDWFGGSANWNTDAPAVNGWNGTGVPDAMGAVANHGVNTGGTTTVDGNYTVGTISYTTPTGQSWIIKSDATAPRIITLNQDGAGSGSVLISNTNSTVSSSNMLDFQGNSATNTLTLNLADNLLVNVTGTGSTSPNGAIRFGANTNISGSGNITLTNNTFNTASALGTIYFQSGNTFTGDFSVLKGSVIFTSGSFAGNTANLITLGSSGSVDASLLAVGTASVANSWATVAGNTGALVMGVYGVGGKDTSFNGDGVLNSNLTFQSNSPATYAAILNGVVSGSGGISTTGTGDTRLTKANTYSGDTKVSSATLRLDNNLALQNSAYDTSGTGVVTLNTGITIPTLGGLIGSKDLATAITTGYSAVTSLTLNPNTGKTYSYSGIIANGATGMTLTKSGVGTQVLSGASSYTGVTTISAGTLNLDSAGSMTARLAGTSGITVSSGTLLLSNSSATASSDRINDLATLTLAGGKLDLGGQSEGAAGTSGLGAFSLTSDSIIDFGSVTGANLIQFGGLGAHTGASLLQITNWEGTFGSDNGTDRLLFAGAASSFVSLYDQSEISFNGNIGYMTTDYGTYYEVYGVPEPSTFALVVGGLSLLIGSRRSRRRA